MGKGLPEYSFEELRARHRGWLNRDFNAERRAARQKSKLEGQRVPLKDASAPAAPHQSAAAALARDLENLAVNDENAAPSQEDIEAARKAKKARKEERANRTRKITALKVKEETRTSE